MCSTRSNAFEPSNNTAHNQHITQHIERKRRWIGGRGGNRKTCA